MLSEKKNTHPAVGAAERAVAGSNFRGQVPTFNSTTSPGKVKGAGGVRA